VTCVVLLIIVKINMLMPVQQNNFTHLRVLLVLTDRGILAQSDYGCPSDNTKCDQMCMGARPIIRNVIKCVWVPVR
jgi:hypothetical protein